MSRTAQVRLGQRSVYFPIKVGGAAWASLVLDVANALENGDLATAESIVARLSACDSSAPGAAVSETADDVQAMRAEAIARVLLDLARSGWVVSREDGRVYVHAPLWPKSGRGLSPTEITAVKAQIRQSLQTRIREQLAAPATRQFLVEMERPRLDMGGFADVRALIADGSALAESIRTHGASAIKPYLQLATGDSGTDSHTGLRFSDIYRYFRYYWSIPSESIPGRTLPFLVRDAGQPRHPVCGLLNLASPVPKLTVRDDALGWTPAWLEAVVAALDCIELEDHDALLDLESQLSFGDGNSRGRASRVLADVAALLRLPASRTARELLHAARSIKPRRVLKSRVTRLRQSMYRDLRNELETAITGVSVRRLGVDHALVLGDPERAIRQLHKVAQRSRRAWLESRQRLSRDSERSVDSEDNLAVLYWKKRADQLLNLCRSWNDLLGLPEDIRAHTLGSSERWPATRALTNGEGVERGIRKALALRQNRFIATQVADLTVCGATPPYGPLLGGKLVALLALSREAAAAYHKKYSKQPSEISSRMAETPVIRPADLVAVTTTSLYAVGTSQYNRLRLPSEQGEIRWTELGVSAGHGTLHFSTNTTECIHRFLRRETGAALITSTFGEGPSERLRKLRDGLVRLSLPADDLLRHGMPRIVFLAELQRHVVRPGARNKATFWRRVGPSSDQIVEFWRERWLEPRLTNRSSLLEEVAFSTPAGLALTAALRRSENRK